MFSQDFKVCLFWPSFGGTVRDVCHPLSAKERHEGIELIIDCRNKKKIIRSQCTIKKKDQRLYLLEVCSAKSHQGMTYNSQLHQHLCVIHHRLFCTSSIYHIHFLSQLFICLRNSLKDTYAKPQSFQFLATVTSGLLTETTQETPQSPIILKTFRTGEQNTVKFPQV